MENRTCRKCGGRMSNPIYIQAQDTISDRHAGQLKRSCTTCGYTSYEEPLDKNGKDIL